MRITPERARALLVTHDHGVLATVHPERGVDAVPVIYAVDEDLVGIPVDRVKPKTGTTLQRERNLQADPRATLLIEHWDPADWSALWWVRASLHRESDPPDRVTQRLEELLAASYVQYHDRPFSHLLVLRVVALSGWSGERSGGSG
ncbi:pyridoxamine 5'-phosphate oxidase family protein [Ornithinimicrobium sp. F0845]|uniref:pyridoxamine 5'-phosphate oxidase family protein n=1 Tax=Ornithinimicrobium sp. F0845 TaxID=2926412 RepID=UPI001FF2457A|nr:pyridoxamine 5'-phosphate oxidase family protein [Ornithinimicrobium sp. F0845]MCK0111460.1 pyridoxamine 5'-phosphate oxidase family protein [Ornithinimicrobium sp. F0845]